MVLKDDEQSRATSNRRTEMLARAMPHEVRKHGYDTDAALIGWTLAVFSLSAGAGSLLGGFARAEDRPTANGRRRALPRPVPLATVVLPSPGSATFFLASAAAGLLLFTPSSVKVVIAQELAPHSPASASGMILGMTSAVAGTLYIALGRLQQTIGLEAGLVVGSPMVAPAALLTAIVLARFAEETGSSRG